MVCRGGWAVFDLQRVRVERPSAPRHPASSSGTRGEFSMHMVGVPHFGAGATTGWSGTGGVHPGSGSRQHVLPGRASDNTRRAAACGMGTPGGRSALLYCRARAGLRSSFRRVRQRGCVGVTDEFERRAGLPGFPASVAPPVNPYARRERLAGSSGRLGRSKPGRRTVLLLNPVSSFAPSERSSASCLAATVGRQAGVSGVDHLRGRDWKPFF